MNLWDVLILVLLAVGVLFALRAIRKGKTGGCGGDCSACSRDCGRRP